MKAYKIRLENKVEEDRMQLRREATLRGKEWEKPEGTKKLDFIFWLAMYAEMNGVELKIDELKKDATLEEIVKHCQKQVSGITLEIEEEK